MDQSLIIGYFGQTPVLLAAAAARHNTIPNTLKILTKTGINDRSNRAFGEAELKGLGRKSYFRHPRPPPDCIRVLGLNPQELPDFISYELLEIPLQWYASLAASSHERDEKVGTVPVQCGQDQILVTPHYRAALTHRRPKDEEGPSGMLPFALTEKGFEGRN
ncbi:hypothetical protein F5Y07DRAFT_403659 [Xylaria sp. FL0933]|nr:hypothetical protein F5Y07DRAFT_403659 [Xylaria sp. FL0933]